MVKYQGKTYTVNDMDGTFGRVQLMDNKTFDLFWVNESEVENI